MDNDVSNTVILCVVADAEIGEILGKLLYTHYPEHKLIFASNGIEAVICTEELNPDIFIVDLDMPTYDLILITKEIRNRGKANQSIALSACNNLDVITKYKKVGLQFCITKPINFDILRQELDTLIKVLPHRPEIDTFNNAELKFFS